MAHCFTFNKNLYNKSLSKLSRKMEFIVAKSQSSHRPVELFLRNKLKQKTRYNYKVHFPFQFRCEKETLQNNLFHPALLRRFKIFKFFPWGQKNLLIWVSVIWKRKIFIKENSYVCWGVRKSCLVL